MDLSTRTTDATETGIFASRRRVEVALVEISHLLVAASAIDTVELLGILGEAMDAESMFLSISDWTREAGVEKPTPSSLVVWHRRGPEAARSVERGLLDAPPIHSGDGSITLSSRTPSNADDYPVELLALPLLAEGERFIGYLGIEHGADAADAVPEHIRVLSVVGDLLTSYYKRLFAERALQENQERWRSLMQLHPDPVIIIAEDEMLYVNRAATRLFGASEPRELLTFVLGDFLPADQQSAFWKKIKQQTTDRVREPFEQEIVRLDGEERVVEVLSAAITYDGRPAAQTVLRDVTDRIATEERYRTFVETISEGVWRIDLAEPLPLELDPELQAAHIAHHGVVGECNAMMSEMVGDGALEQLIGLRLREAFPDFPLDGLLAFVRSGYRLENFEFSTQYEGRERRHLSLNAVGRIDRGRLLRIWGSCIEITARVEMERRMVAVLEEEQERIGRDLHDGVGQLLTGVRMLSENLMHRLETSDSAVAATLEKVNSFALEASQRVRDICRGLAPPQLSQEPLAMSLDMLCAQLGSYQSTACDFEWDQQAEVRDPEAKIQLYRIAQEAANNALRHGNPERLTLRLREKDDTVILEIVDDGTGFDVGAEQGSSLGLYSMHRRASSVRAKLSVESKPGEGTRVRTEYRESGEQPDFSAAGQ